MLSSPADVPPHHFPRKPNCDRVTEGLDLTGKTMLVTGCTSGLGWETLRILAMRGAHVLAGGRTLASATAAWERVRSAVPASAIKGRATPFACEHTNLDSVVAFADAVTALKVPLDAIICNAGLGGYRAKYVEAGGIEQQFFVNHVSHFALVNRLLPQVKQAAQGRIVMVSSFASSSAPNGIDFDGLRKPEAYKPMTAYAQSKLANLLMARELSRRFEGTAMTANSTNPGVAKTSVFSNANPPLVFKLLMLLYAPFMTSASQGAASQVYCATAPSLAKITGVYFTACLPEEPPTPIGKSDAEAAKLWAWSEDFARKYL